MGLCLFFVVVFSFFSCVCISATIIPVNKMCSVYHQNKLKQICIVRKEGNVLFNNTLNTFCLLLYGVRHLVKDHSDSENGNLLPPHGLLFPISNKGFL